MILPYLVSDLLFYRFNSKRLSCYLNRQLNLLEAILKSFTMFLLNGNLLTIKPIMFLSYCNL
jgi:hypothetical protein